MDRSLINSHLEKVLQSRYFRKSKISCDLLEYLVHASLEEKNPKEFTIGVELFGKKYDHEAKQDSNIRVYIHHVRKKLTQYYENEGAKDPVIFEIERGKYTVRFKTPKDFAKNKHRSYLIPFLLSMAGLLATLFFLLTGNREKPNKFRQLPIWHEMAQNKKKTLLVLGDYFVFHGMLPTGKTGVYRDFSINSEADYEYLLDKKPELIKTISKSNLTYLSKMAAFCESDIYKVFAQTGGEIDVKLLSDIQPTDLKDFNIIFIGNYKNMGIFENLVREMSFTFSISNASIPYIISNDPCARVYEPQSDKLKEEDYALVINASGYSDNRFLLFLSSQDIGNISTVKQLTQHEYLKHFQEEQLKPLELIDFKALYKVEGINKTDLSFELIHIE